MTEPVQAEQTVLSQTLGDNLFWTRRVDRYTLQVVTEWRMVPVTPSATLPNGMPRRRRELPRIEVWLLRKDGTLITAMQRWETPPPKAEVHVTVPKPEVLYAFPKTEGAGAVVAVIRTDDQYVVRKIALFTAP